MRPESSEPLAPKPVGVSFIAQPRAGQPIRRQVCGLSSTGGALPLQRAPRKGEEERADASGMQRDRAERSRLQRRHIENEVCLNVSANV